MEEFRKGQQGRGGSSPYILPLSQNPHCKASCLSDVCTSGKDPESGVTAQRQREINLIAIKPQTASQGRAVLLGSSPCCFLLRCPLPTAFFFVKHMCHLRQFIQILDRSPLGLWKGPPSCNKIRSFTCRMARTEPGVLLM